MNDLAIRDSGASAVASGGARKPDEPARIADAATQFEALLIGQLLRSAREGAGGWSGEGTDSAGDCATDLAEQQFATALAGNSGLGLARLISAGLHRSAEAVESPSAPGRKADPVPHNRTS